jgi:hypothetical protein
MGHDGGLGDAHAALKARAVAAVQQQEINQRDLAAGLRDQASRINDAIGAFLETADKKSITPERFVVGQRQIGPKPRARFGRDQRDVWGFHSRPIPTEPIYADGYTIHRWTEIGDGYGAQEVILMPPARVELREKGTRTQTSVRENEEDPLPFYVGHGGRVESGMLKASDIGIQLRSIQETSAWFVERLATYIFEHEPS